MPPNGIGVYWSIMIRVSLWESKSSWRFCWYQGNPIQGWQATSHANSLSEPQHVQARRTVMRMAFIPLILLLPFISSLFAQSIAGSIWYGHRLAV